MKRSYFSTLAMTLVLGGLLAWYFAYEKKIKPKQVEKEGQEKQFVTLARTDIQELDFKVLQDPDGPHPDPSKAEFREFKLKKSGENWSLTQPIQTPADTGTISSLLSTLTSAKQERVVEENAKELKTYGLDLPRATITVRKDSGSPDQTLLVGANTPTGSGLYVKLATSATVYRAEQTLWSSFNKDLKSLREKSLFTTARADVEEVEIQLGKEEPFLVKREEKDKWSLARQNLPVETSEWNKTLSALIDLKAVEFVSETAGELFKYGLANPRARVRVTDSKDKSKVGLILGEAKGKFYAKRDDRTNIVEIDKEVANKVTRPWATYRSLRVAEFSRFDVNRVKLERDKESIELLKQDKDWTFPGEASVKVDATQVDKLLIGLQDARLVRYLTDKPATAPKNPSLVIRLMEKKDSTETEKVALTFGPVNGQEVVVTRTGFNYAFVIKAEDFKKLNISKQSLIKVDPPPSAPKTEAPESSQKKSE